MEKRPKKLLSLDGGGSWAILQAMALKETYKNTPVGTKCRDILNEFDVISANSGGSLMLAGMIEKADEDIDEVIAMFLNENVRKKIFNRLKSDELKLFERLGKLFNIGPRYSANRKLSGIKAALKKTGEISMSALRQQTGIRPNIIICGFDYDLNRASFFRTGKNHYTLADAVNVASNAPVNYFDQPVKAIYDDGVSHRYWDGAVGGNNNPVLVGITEVLRIFDQENLTRSNDDIQVLSIGTANNMLPVSGYTKTDKVQDKNLLKQKEKNSLENDIKKMAQSIISDPPEAANFMAHMFLGGSMKENAEATIIRMNALIQPVLVNDTWSFPVGLDLMQYKDFIDLIQLDMDAVKQDEIVKIQKLGQWWISDIIVNQSIRYENDTFRCLIGYDRFSKAREEWLRRTDPIKQIVAEQEQNPISAN
jgi:uncharacterized protein